MTPPVPVPTGVIDILVNAAVQFDLIPPDRAAMLELGEALTDQNASALVATTCARTTPLYPPPEHELEMAHAPFKPGAVLAVLDYYEDNSDEAPRWEATAAARLVTQLREAALQRMPQDARVRHAEPGWPHGRPAYLKHPDYVDAVRVPPRAVGEMPTVED